MKRSISLLSALAFVLASSGSVFAQTNLNQNITAKASVVNSVQFSDKQDVDFKQIQADITNATGVTPTIDPTSGPSHSGIDQGTPVVGYVEFTATGGQAITVTNPGTQTLTNQSNGNYEVTYNPNLCIQDAAATNNSCNTAGGTNQDVSLNNLASGTGTVFIGGTLTDPKDGTNTSISNLDPGTYSKSSVPINIDYSL